MGISTYLFLRKAKIILDQSTNRKKGERERATSLHRSQKGWEVSELKLEAFREGMKEGREGGTSEGRKENEARGRISTLFPKNRVGKKKSASTGFLGQCWPTGRIFHIFAVFFWFAGGSKVIIIKGA